MRSFFGGRRTTSRRHRVDPYPYLLNVPAVVVLVIVIGVPLVKVVIMSLSNYSFIGDSTFTGLDNFIYLFTKDRTVWATVRTTVVWTVVSLTLEFLFALITSLLLNKIRHLKGILRALILLPWVVPPVTAGLVWKTILDSDSGVLNNILEGLGLPAQPLLASPNQAMAALILVAVWRYSPFMVISLLAGLQSIDHELYEASALDGARPAQQFWHITWPLLRPVVLVVVAMGTVWRVGHFDLVNMMTGGGPAGSTELLSTLAYGKTIDQLNGGVGAAVAVVTLVVTLLVGFPIFRRLLKERGA
ncbi:MAG: sugar ABC transporter permease [Propionibacteriaceae bacterium]|nr:sugar ABC transporter permease [Propionibacteriaceae bacterium]